MSPLTAVDTRRRAVATLATVTALLLLGLAPAAQAGQHRATTTINVNPITSKDTNPGTATLPLRTLTEALTLAQSGTTIQLAAGDYGPGSSGDQFPAGGLPVPAGVTITGALPQLRDVERAVRRCDGHIRPSHSACRHDRSGAASTTTNTHTHIHDERRSKEDMTLQIGDLEAGARSLVAHEGRRGWRQAPRGRLILLDLGELRRCLLLGLYAEHVSRARGGRRRCLADVHPAAVGPKGDKDLPLETGQDGLQGAAGQRHGLHLGGVHKSEL